MVYWIAHDDDIPSAIDELFLRCLGRRPATPELNYVTAAYRDVLQLTKHESSKDEPSQQPKVTAMTAVARVVMNLDEFITRD